MFFRFLLLSVAMCCAHIVIALPDWVKGTSNVDLTTQCSSSSWLQRIKQSLPRDAFGSSAWAFVQNRQCSAIKKITLTTTKLLSGKPVICRMVVYEQEMKHLLSKTKNGLRVETLPIAFDFSHSMQKVSLQNLSAASLTTEENRLNLSDGTLRSLIAGYESFLGKLKPNSPTGLQLVIISTRKRSVEYGAEKAHIRFAKLSAGNRTYDVYRFDSKAGSYYVRPDAHPAKRTQLLRPVQRFKITSRFGRRIHPLLGCSHIHGGVDMGAPSGTMVFATHNGQVSEMCYRRGYGNYVKISGAGEFATAYAHLRSFARNLRVGARVKAGQLIGYIGQSGTASGPHLHYEVWINGVRKDPLKYTSVATPKLEGENLRAFLQQKQKIHAIARDLRV